MLEYNRIIVLSPGHHDQNLVVLHLVVLAQLGGGQGLVDVADDVRPVLKVDGDLDYVDAHRHHVAAGGAVVSGPGVALQSIGQVSSEIFPSLSLSLSLESDNLPVQEMVAQIIVAPPDRFFDAV